MNHSGISYSSSSRSPEYQNKILLKRKYKEVYGFCIYFTISDTYVFWYKSYKLLKPMFFFFFCGAYYFVCVCVINLFSERFSAAVLE